MHDPFKRTDDLKDVVDERLGRLIRACERGWPTGELSQSLLQADQKYRAELERLLK